ncbi:MAG TPA: M50 family metallopeptidase [Caulobacteraceae bacterium]|jgi:regulator of sigma E protease|nr:M50 family metallopeptidase [Caulobacteraceae bacterium]
MVGLVQSLAASVAPFVLVISLIVTIHELGHFLVGKACGVAIDRFSLGFGRAIISWRDKSGVEWRLGWLPLGGYVKFAGDENAAGAATGEELEALRGRIHEREGAGAEAKYMAFKPVWQRVLIVLAGPFANFVLSTVIFAVFFMTFGESTTRSVVTQVVPHEAAAQAGFAKGDVIVAADGKPMPTFDQVEFYVRYRGGVPIDFTVDRAGRTVHLRVTPASKQEASDFGGTQTVGKIGLGAAVGAFHKLSPIAAVTLGVQRTWDVGATTLYYLGRIVTGQIAPDQLHSIVGMVHASGALTHQAIDVGHRVKINWLIPEAVFLSQMAAVMSVSIGLLNLLPIPTLDGGHLVFYAYEWVAKRPAAARVQAAGYRAGLALLVGLMLFATWNDVSRLSLFRFLGIS